jgi:hypothetical protein
MGETTSEVRHEIEEARSRLDQDLNRLEYRWAQATDWRYQAHRHPLVLLGAMIAAAALVGTLVFRRIGS